jgi:asparagine synthase (glutamine-hydrolysing)
MCGFVGSASNSSLLETHWITEASERISHRGPDDAGIWRDDHSRVVLAHRRLSILDLSSLGHQPMHLSERGLSIVFNGEIYNHGDLRNELEKLGHQFRSHTDTEVLLASYAQWGTGCLERLNGMFAFALYDEPFQKIFLARDRAGEKPLFYRLDQGILYFASELKALLEHPKLPKRIDSQAFDCFLAMGYVPGNLCILDGYQKLPPAHALTFNLCRGNAKVWRYWELPEFDISTDYADEVELLDELESLLEDAVGRQLVADVPVGILLSGGVDSSLVTAMAVRRSRQVRTFSIGFPGHGKLDETPHARLIANHFGTKHTELIAEPTSAELMPTLARQFDEPMVDSSMFPTWLVSHLVRQHCTVALGGDGGDELFAGYGSYSNLLRIQAKTKHLPTWFRRAIAQLAEHHLPAGLKGRNYLQGLDVDLGIGLPLLSSFFDPTQRRRLLRGHNKHPIVAELIRASRIPQQHDLLQRATRMDFENYLAEDILVKVDRASMLNSLEVRSAFLDHRLIEFAFGKVPGHLKATKIEKKILLKRLAARLLPPEFDKHRKQGFSIPLSEWLKSGPFRDLFWDTLSCSDCIFDAKTVRSLLSGQDAGFSNSERLFALVQFELWRKTYHVSL